jgi:predicted Zn-dependent protease with MMP-like domain
MPQDLPPLSEEQDAIIADRLSRIWEAYRSDDAALGVRLGTELVSEFPDHGEAWFWLACCRERLGELREADRCFLRANRARIEPQAGPFRIPWRRFQQAVDAAAEGLPAKLRSALGELTLVLTDYADPGLIAGNDEPEMLGLFVGLERSDRDSASEPQPSPRIYLFRRAHEHSCASRAEFDIEVRQTLWHELGHYLGYDENGLEELGLD